MRLAVGPGNVTATVSAVVPIFDAQGQPDGYGPSVPGVFQARSDLSNGDTWSVTSVSIAGVIVTPLPGGNFTITVPAGTTPGSYSFDWLLNGPAPTTGSFSFDIT